MRAVTIGGEDAEGENEEGAENGQLARVPSTMQIVLPYGNFALLVNALLTSQGQLIHSKPSRSSRLVCDLP